MLGRHLSMTRAQLGAEIGLPPTTVSRLVKELNEAGIVREGPAARCPGRVGRPEREISLVGPVGFIALIAQSHDEVAIALGSFDGAVRYGVTAEVPAIAEAPALVDWWVRLLEEVLDRQQRKWSDVAGVVVGLPRPYLRTAGRWQGPTGLVPARLGPSAPVLREAALQLADRLPTRVLAENDANLGALGEAVFGAGTGAPSIVYVKVVNDIGAGIVVDGRIQRGARGIAGGLAHVSVADGPECFCGGSGCLAAVVGHLGRRLLSPVYGSTVTVAQAVERAATGDSRAQSCLVELGRVLGMPLSGLCSMLDPGAVVIDGRLGAPGTHVVAGIEEMLARQAPLLKAQGMKMLRGGLGHDAELYGSVALFREAYVEALCARDWPVRGTCPS